MSKIKTVTEFLIEDSTFKCVGARPVIYSDTKVNELLKAYGAHVREVTLQEAAENAKASINKGGSDSHFYIIVDQDSILALKDSENLKIE